MKDSASELIDIVLRNTRGGTVEEGIQLLSAMLGTAVLASVEHRTSDEKLIAIDTFCDAFRKYCRRIMLEHAS